jgi:hypothetical protein
MSSDSDAEAAPAPPPPPAGPALPALFWDAMPEDLEANPDMAAMQALIDESTPEERAASFKEQGNRALRLGLQQRKKFYLREAVDQYGKGLELRPNDAALAATLYANRAQANLLLGNDRAAMLDGLDAVRADAAHVKGHFRAAKGAFGCRQWERVAALCAAGAALEPGGAEFPALAAKARAAEVAEAAAAAAEAARQAAARAPAAALAAALAARGVRVGRPQFSVHARKPALAPDGSVVWPVLLFYPEAAMGSDSIEAWGEGEAFADHLDAMFGPDAPPLEWDSEKQYTRDAIEVYYLAHAAPPLGREDLVEALHGGWPAPRGDEAPQRYGAKAAGWVRVDERWALGEALARRDHVVPGVPAFFVLARGAPGSEARAFRERFLAGELPLL